MFTNVSLFVSFNNGPSVHFQTQTIYVRTISIKRKINVYRVSKCSNSTAKHLRGETVMVKPFLVSFHHLNLSHSVSFHSVWLVFPLSSPLPLTPAPCPPLVLCCQVSRSVSVWLNGWAPLWLPCPSHLPLTSTSSSLHLLAPWAYGWLSGLNSSWL